MRPVLVLGSGNRLMSDDGVGPKVVDAVGAMGLPGVEAVDGGSVGLALLPMIEEARALIAVDAARFHAPPGTVRVFEGAEMDRMLAGARKTAHEVALADLLSAAGLSGRRPPLRALVAASPEKVSLGLDLSPPVAAALEEMIAATRDLALKWREEAAA